MPSLFTLINRLLPFATPGTPLAQDLAHLIALCSLLYFAPQIQEWAQSTPSTEETHEQNEPVPEQAFPNVDAAEANQANLNRAAEPGPANIPFQNNDGPADREDEDDEAPDAARPGPANETRKQRAIGAKKAKSIAARDQRRAYYEFQRSQGEAQRAREAEGAAEREAYLSAERERRRAAEVALEAKKTKERERKREAERKEREEEIRMREEVLRLVRREVESEGMCDLFKVARMVGRDVDEEWVEKIVMAGGLIGTKEGAVTMITGMGWVVRVTRVDMDEMYQTALVRGGNGKHDNDTLGGALETVLRRKGTPS